MQRAILTVVSGPNVGDTLSIEIGSCRLVGRHLSESETAMIDRDGNRVLDGSSTGILEKHLQESAPEELPKSPASMGSFERGPDIILADDSVSRAHAMLFFEKSGFGIIDLASTNGSHVNKAPVTSTIVQDGDSITLGTTEFALSIPA